jgi:hypothetical protein
VINGHTVKPAAKYRLVATADDHQKVAAHYGTKLGFGAASEIGFVNEMSTEAGSLLGLADGQDPSPGGNAPPDFLSDESFSENAGPLVQGGCLPVNAPDDFPESEAFVDCAGKQRVFALECHQVPTGWSVTANEVTDNDFGYRFECFSPSNPYLALGQVRGKIRAGLATRYLSAAEPEPSLSNDILCGHVDWDRTTDRPVLVVDGRPLSMFDLERILRSYEGWRVELRIVDATE